MINIYGLIFVGEDQKSLTEYKEVLRTMQTPILYTNNATELMSNYSILLDTEFLEEEFMDRKIAFCDTAEYDRLFEGIVKLFIDSNTFIGNKEYEAYGFSSDISDSNGIYRFSYMNKYEFTLVKDSKTFKRIYPIGKKYYVVFDENQNVDNVELFHLLTELCNNIGKDNTYTSIKEWKYIDEEKAVELSFYIFYSGSEPTELICRELVRKHVIDKYGLEEAKIRFPRLFISDERKVFCVYENAKLPIKYDVIKGFIERNNVLGAEIVHALDYKSPLVVEYGLSDIYPNYSSIKCDDPTINNFLYYITEVLNYYNGKKLTQRFKEESQFVEYDEYCSVNTGGIQWDVMKFSYNK